MAILRNGSEVDYAITYKGAEFDRATHNGSIEVYAGLSGKYVIENSILNEKFASGEFETESACSGNTTGTSSKVALTLDDKLVGKPMKMTFRGYTTVTIYNKNIERYAYAECDGNRVATVDLITATQSKQVDETVTVTFTPTSNIIYVGTYVRRTADQAQVTQTNRQIAKIIDLQIL